MKPLAKLFVYGTLKSGLSNNHRMAGQRLIGPAVTMPIYRLHGLGWHPGMVLDTENGLAIEGEIWEVDAPTLAALDEFEGIPTFFDREPVAIKDHFEDVEAYFYKQEVPPGAPTGNVWPFPA